MEEEVEEEEETEEDAVERMKTEISENYESDLGRVTGAVVCLCTMLFTVLCTDLSPLFGFNYQHELGPIGTIQLSVEAVA